MPVDRERTVATIEVGEVEAVGERHPAAGAPPRKEVAPFTRWIGGMLPAA
jgi:hypothetical protein